MVKNDHPLNQFYSKIYKKYDLVNRLFTLGMDTKWRRITVRECLENNPGNIIDVCCGTGDLAIALLQQGKVPVTGYDFSEHMIDTAHLKAHAKGLNITFIQGDVAAMPFNKNEFDAITIGFGFRNLVYENSKAKKHINELNRILKKEGRLYILESGVPKSFMVRVLYKMYLHLILVPLGGLISGNWKAYSYLAGSSINYFTINQLQKFLHTHGFEIEKVHRFFLGASNLVTAIKTKDVD